MATHSNTLAWKIPWTEEPGSLQSMGSQRGGRRESDTTERRHFHFPHLLLFSVYKRNWHSDPDKIIRWSTSLPSSRTPSFPNKVVFLASAPCLPIFGLLCCKQTELGFSNTHLENLANCTVSPLSCETFNAAREAYASIMLFVLTKMD